MLNYRCYWLHMHGSDDDLQSKRSVPSIRTSMPFVYFIQNVGQCQDLATLVSHITDICQVFIFLLLL